MGRKETVQEWFCRIRDQLQFLEEERGHVEDMRLQSEGPRGQQYGSIGHGSGNRDANAALLAAIQAESNYQRRLAHLEAMTETALQILYGRSGRGGLAKAKDSAAADSICGYYLMGMSWGEVASELVRPDSADGAQWCKRRAYRGFEYIGKRGARQLINS